jgi:glycosyltransferase involved in cell wall biosynthesis
MVSRHVFILVPALVPTGPIKGAYALANALASDRTVTLVSLRGGPGANAPLDDRVQRVSLAAHRTFVSRKRAYRELLRAAGGRDATATISMCLSADVTSILCSDDSVTCASVRGNLHQNYLLDYGQVGRAVAAAHLLLLRGVDHVVVMTESMEKQVSRFTGRGRVSIIGNFIDEESVEKFRAAAPPDGPLQFVFMGSLTERKQPLTLVNAVAQLRATGIDARAQFLGEGPMETDLRRAIERRGLDAQVTLQGFMSAPYEILSQADALVLPSLSEGISRACLEAMHLGVPCVLRAVDGHGELIRPGANGVLFDGDEQLAPAMLSAARLAREAKSAGARPSLLPAEFRQAAAARAYLHLVET